MVVGGHIYCLQPWKRHFDPTKEKLNTVLLWIRLPRLPLEMWNGKVLKHIISPIGNLSKINNNSEEVAKGLFARICVEVDVSKPLKRTIKYVLVDVYRECLLDYENITSICFGFESQSHKFDSYKCNSKNIALELESFKRFSQVDDTHDFCSENKPIHKKRTGWKLVRKELLDLSIIKVRLQVLIMLIL